MKVEWWWCLVGSWRIFMLVRCRGLGLMICKYMGSGIIMDETGMIMSETGMISSKFQKTAS